MAGIDSLRDSAIGESAAQYWEKTIKDMNNVDESFANARDLGQTRLNYTRLTAVGKIANYDKVDIYKTSVSSPRGQLRISLMTSSDNDKVLNLSKYEKYLDKLKQELDPVGYAKEQLEKRKAEEKKNDLEYTAPGMRIEVYTTNRQGKQILVADSAAEEGSDEFIAMTQMLNGEYNVKGRGDYYIKVSRAEDNTSTEEVPYAVQIQMGDTFKQDYVAMEQDSDDTKNKKESKIPLTGTSGNLSAVNALQIQASRYQATAQMLADGYMNLANLIYKKNSKF